MIARVPYLAVTECQVLLQQIRAPLAAKRWATYQLSRSNHPIRTELLRDFIRAVLGTHTPYPSLQCVIVLSSYSKLACMLIDVLHRAAATKSRYRLVVRGERDALLALVGMRACF